VQQATFYLFLYVVAEHILGQLLIFQSNPNAHLIGTETIVKQKIIIDVYILSVVLLIINYFKELNYI